MREAVIVASVRSAGGRARRGGLKETRPDELIAQVIKALVAKTPQVSPATIDDIVLGCCFPEGEQGLNIARVAAKMAGLPDDVAGVTVNRFCSSGLQAIADVAARIRSGWIDIGIGGGIESMSTIPMGGTLPRPNLAFTQDDGFVYLSMGTTAENVAKRYNITREMQDEFALRSNMRAAEAQQKGWFPEIVPINATRYTVGKDGKRAKETYVFDKDDGVRPETTLQGLAALRPAFFLKGSVTAGNSSQTTDGAAATMLMSEDKAKELGLKPLAKFKAFAVAGCRADEMGVGPKYAIPKLMKITGLSVKDIDFFELNEAFASQALYCSQELGLDMNKVNICGGAIALGHPLGCTGAKLTATLLSHFKRLGGKYGVVSMCIGGGMGAAGLIEYLGN